LKFDEATWVNICDLKADSFQTDGGWLVQYLARYLAEIKAGSVPYVVDDTSNVARAFGASVTPEAFLFAADGKLAYHGTIDDNRTDADKVGAHYLGDALAAVVAGHSPKTTETKSLGYGIKFRGQPRKP
jgi:hypothetical protein